MIRILLVSLSLFSQITLAAEKEQLENLMQNYLLALGKGDVNVLKEITTPKYYSQLAKNNGLEVIFAKNKGFKNGAIQFDMKFQDGARNKDLTYVNIKPKKAKDYGDHWYVIKKDKNKLVIDDMRFWD